MFNAHCAELFVINLIILFETRFRACEILFIRGRTTYHTHQESSTILLESTALVSSANIMCSNKAFILGGRSFTCIMKIKGPKTDQLQLRGLSKGL